VESLAVCAVDDENDEIGVGEVGVPARAQRLLAADVPHEKVDVLADDFLDVGANRGRRVDHLVHEKLIQNRCLPSVVLTTKRHNPRGDNPARLCFEL
jgi:hypothetical protein